ncbi:MAG: aminotransferase class V-fold PLP-dependent enzyme [Phycisphaera sp.]|nr:aminotransferase class V-fold PLP-dependent enzyme [Phycisphaera sp.]
MTANPYAQHWSLDPDVVFLNHGSFGACPRAVLEAQQRYRAQMEAEPVRFFTREMQPLLDASRAKLASLLGADADDVVFIRNATEGVNAVLRSLTLNAGDEVLTTDHAYNACRNVLDFVAARAGATVRVAAIPFPIASPDEAVEPILAAVTDRTRIALIDHITSPTGLVLPIERIVAELAERGVDTLVDGAHAPGMLPLDLTRLGAAYYTGNCHKWLCAPKGAAFLHVRAERQADVMPAVISHGANSPRAGRSRYSDLFDWPGTFDPTAWLCVGHAVDFVGTLMPGGLDALMRHNHEQVLAARAMLAESMGVDTPCPDAMVGSIASLPLPPRFDGAAKAMDTSTTPTPSTALHTWLLREHGIETPVFVWPAPPSMMLRVSAQAYNDAAQYERLHDALQAWRG